MVWPRVARKCRKTVTHDGRRLRRPDLGASGGGWLGNFTDVVIWSSSSSLVGACIMVVVGIDSHDCNLNDLKMGQNDPVRWSRFWGDFSRVLELKMSVLGLGFHLSRKARFI